MWRALRCQASPLLSTARFFSSSVARTRQRVSRNIPLADDLAEWDLEADFSEFQGDDIPATGHMYLDQQRQVAHYLRLIENELPELVAFRKPFVPPSASTPLVVRSVDYAGESHPATVKRSVVVPVAQLPLKNEAAVHRAKLLAGVRWSIEPPKNSGVQCNSEEGKHGYIKISCEDFPRPSMNLKWISDTIDGLVAEANDENHKTYQDLPLDTRHLEAQVMKAKEGEHARGRNRRPSIKDFPTEWLARSVSQSVQPTTNS
ncbi:mitochondrial ribosomal subunit protein-domain-containing protein [Pisolithus tinctorius]|nr:mitochondrial ribosomal subunit protein-domain-containing protein [Pisolithus tinctorius]